MHTRWWIRKQTQSRFLFNDTQVLFRHAVDASWAAQVTRNGYFVWVLVHDISLEHVSDLSFDQLVKA
jgi:hypothetical protein